MEKAMIEKEFNEIIEQEYAKVAAGEGGFLLAKYNSSGTLQWQRILGGASSDIGRGVVVDSSDNVYLVGQTASTGSGGTNYLIAKYNSSGTIQWQRSLTGSGTDEAYGVALDSKDNLNIVGLSASVGAGGNDFLIAKLPNDGSLTGTYALNSVNLTYATSSLTAATSTLTGATTTLTSSTSTLTAATPTLTSSTSTLTTYKVTI